MVWKHAVRGVVIAVMVCMALPVQAAAPDSFAPIIDPLLPAVVNISTTQKITQQGTPGLDLQKLPNTPQGRAMQEMLRQQFGGGQPSQKEVNSLGSGFVIDESGYVVTNNHVVGNAEAITVIFQDNTRLPATIVGRDEKTDLALLKVKSEKPLIFVKFGDSDTMRVGDWVIAVGNPFGLGGSVSAGIVSARGRNINAGPFDDFIQTDAAINRGNSGGPLFNTKGEVIGVNSAIFSPTGGNIGIGFALPSSLVKSVVGGLREFGKINRGWLGVKIAPVSDELADSLGLGKPRGALLSDLSENGPAAAGGLQAGDVVLKFDGRDVDEMRKLPRYVADTKSGKKVEVVYWRKGKEEKARLTVGDLPKETDPDDVTDSPSKPDIKPQSQVLGMRLIPLTPQTRAQLNINANVSGLLIESLEDNSDSLRRGLRAGDIIVEVNQGGVTSIDAMKAALATAKKNGRNFVLLRILRGNQLLFATVPLK